MIDAEGVAYILVAACVALVFKIVWDWLKQRKQSGPVFVPCTEDSSCHPVGVLREKQIRMEEREKITKQQLKDGKENFAVMQNDITEIKGNVQAIVAVINERNKSGSSLLQT